MGEEVFVTRAAHHVDGAQVPILEEDWRAVIDNDPDLTAPDEAYPSYAVWVGAPHSGSHWIDWVNGNLFTRRPGTGLLRKLLELADILGARVQNPHGDPYSLSPAGVVVPPPNEPADVVEGDHPGADATALDFLDAIDEARGLVEIGLADAADETPVTEPPADGFFGPRPRNAGEEHEVPADGFELQADASFARRPEEKLTAEPARTVAVDVPFVVGQRVRTEWGRPATVVSIDCEADMGAGKIEIRYDDGRVATTDCLSHGLRPLPR